MKMHLQFDKKSAAELFLLGKGFLKGSFFWKPKSMRAEVLPPLFDVKHSGNGWAIVYLEGEGCQISEEEDFDEICKLRGVTS